MDNHDDVFPVNNQPPTNLPVDQPASQPQPAQQFSPPPAPEPVQQPQQQPSPTPTPPPIPSRPAYAPPIPDLSPQQKPERKKGPSLLSVIIAVLAVIIILALGFLLYYFATKTFQSSVAEKAPVAPVKVNKPVVTQPVVPAVPAVIPTKVIAFIAPIALPAEQKSGNCWVNSIAEPYRKDAWRCMIGSVIYDPCFQTSQTGVVDCPMDLLSGSGSETIIKTIKPLPQAILPATIKDNWAWLVKTEDSIFFSPYTGTKPFIDGAFATYGSKIVNGERYVLMGDLIKDNVWTAQKKVLVKNGNSWITKTTETVKLDTVWQ